MDKEQLQQKIAEYFVKLPKEAQDVFSSMNWMQTLVNIDTKYGLNENQIELLGTETTLVLLGITHIEEFQKNIETQLGLPEDIIKKIYGEIDESILKTIKNQLIDTFENNALQLFKENPDPNFSGLPMNVQIAVAESGWKEKLYSIANKYKLSIEQMGILEEITIKVMTNEIPPYEYENKIISRMSLPKEDISNLVNDVNNDVLKTIRELLKEDWNIGEKIETDEVPLPPYAKTEIKVETPKVVEAPKSYKPVEEITQLPPKNIIEEKLKNVTASNRTVSNYSVPPVVENKGDEVPQSHDPYREPIK
jgi:hypothetical protein